MKQRRLFWCKVWMRVFILLGFLIVFNACGFQEIRNGKEPELVVFAAASLTDVFQEVGRIYEKQAGKDILFNFAGSNVLAQQILASSKEGVFVSADGEWMDVLENAGRIEAGTRRVLFSNTLVVISHSSTSWEMDYGTDLCGLDFRFLVLGNPEGVPVGRYAKQWLQSLSCDGRTLWESISDRVSPAPDVRSVLGQVASIEAIGVVYRTDYTVARDRVKLLYSVAAKEGPPIRYWAAQLQQVTHSEGSESFLQFLYSDAARSIFSKHGFGIIRDQ